jgi:hypothetical protein
MSNRTTLNAKPRQWYDARTYRPGRRTFRL